MAGAYRVQAFFRLGVDVRGDNPADKNYVVAGGYLRFQCTFEIGDSIGQE